MPPIEVLIVDDHPVFRQGICDVMDSEEDITVVGQAADGKIAIEMALDLAPDVILMDVNLPSTTGLQVTRQVKKTLVDTKVVVLTAYDEVEQVFHALGSGASAYCPKDIMPEVLIETIHSVRKGLYVVGEKTMSYEEVVSWIEEKVGRSDTILSGNIEDVLNPLSPREMEILEHVTAGMSNKEIAFSLGISHQTVKNHMTSILRKLRVEDRTQAAVFALQHGWVRLMKDDIS